jgi:hypothetical protein
VLDLVVGCVDPCPADLDGNCTVNIQDFLILLANWTPPGGGPCASCAACVGDINGDGIINIVDFLALLGRWGDCENCQTFAGARSGGGMDDLIAALNLLGFADLEHYQLWVMNGQEPQVWLSIHALATILMGQDR